MRNLTTDAAIDFSAFSFYKKMSFIWFLILYSLNLIQICWLTWRTSLLFICWAAASLFACIFNCCFGACFGICSIACFYSLATAGFCCCSCILCAEICAQEFVVDWLFLIDSRIVSNFLSTDFSKQETWFWSWEIASFSAVLKLPFFPDCFWIRISFIVVFWLVNIARISGSFLRQICTSSRLKIAAKLVMDLSLSCFF